MKKIYTAALLLCLSKGFWAQEIDITGKNISIPSGATLSIANNNTYFGEQISASGSIKKSYSIVNTGTANLVLSGNPLVSITNSDFSVVAMPAATILPGGSTSFEISFDPSTNASISGTVSIANNDANENPYTFRISGLGLASRTAHWVNNTGATRPATVALSGDTYSTAATTYTTIQAAVNAATSFDIIYVTNGRYMNPAELTSTNCVAGGPGQDPNLNININKSNIIITSETGDFRTSSAKLIGYSLNLTDTIGNVTIQGLTLDSIRQNAIYNSDYVYLPTSLNTPNVRILNNKISNVRGHGIKTDTRSAFVIDRGMWEIDGNHIENVGFYNGAANCTGTLNTSAMWLGEAGSSYEIKNNTIINAKWGGILCIGFGNPSGSTNGAVTITGNKIFTTGNVGIQVGWTTTGGFYVPSGAYIMNNHVQNANTSQAIGIGAISMVQSNIKNVKIMHNNITDSYNGLTIQVAGWQDNANDTTIVRFNNFCNLVAGSAGILHIAGISPNGLFGTADDLFKYKFDNNYFGSPSGPTYSNNPGGTGASLVKESGANAFYSANNFNYMPFRTSRNEIPVASPGAVMGASVICEGTYVYSIEPVAGATSYSWNLPGGWTGTSSGNTISATTGTAGGSVLVFASTPCGTTTASSKVVVVNPLPNVSASTSNTLICAGESATLTAINASTYAWSNSSSGASIVVSPVNTTTYTVTGTNASGCSKAYSLVQNVAECAGISETSTENNVVVFPNPGRGIFTVSSSMPLTKITVINNIGQVVKTISSDSNINEVDLNGLSEGIYFIVAQNKEQQLINKVLLTK